MFRALSRRTYKTIKSINDESTNQPLLGRLKQISVSGHTEIKPLPVPIKQEQCRRTLTLENLEKILEYHVKDPLVWNESMLGRIYNVEENHCTTLCRYVLPFTQTARASKMGAEELLETQIVIDISLFKEDKSYLPLQQKLLFVDNCNTKMLTRNTEANANEALAHDIAKQ